MPWSLKLFGPVCSVEVEVKSTTVAGFLAFGCSADSRTLQFSGAANDGFLQNMLKTLFRLSRVFLDL